MANRWKGLNVWEQANFLEKAGMVTVGAGFGSGVIFGGVQAMSDDAPTKPIQPETNISQNDGKRQNQAAKNINAAKQNIEEAQGKKVEKSNKISNGGKSPEPNCKIKIGYRDYYVISAERRNKVPSNAITVNGKPITEKLDTLVLDAVGLRGDGEPAVRKIEITPLGEDQAAVVVTNFNGREMDRMMLDSKEDKIVAGNINQLGNFLLNGGKPTLRTEKEVAESLTNGKSQSIRGWEAQQKTQNGQPLSEDDKFFKNIAKGLELGKGTIKAGFGKRSVLVTNNNTGESWNIQYQEDNSSLYNAVFHATQGSSLQEHLTAQRQEFNVDPEIIPEPFLNIIGTDVIIGE